MFTARKKIVKPAIGKKKLRKLKGVNPTEPTEFEETVAQTLFDLEATNAELKADLRDLHIVGAKEISLPNSARKVIVIHIPKKLIDQFRKIQARLIRELEKKFSGRDVVIVAKRKIMPIINKTSQKDRPVSQTVTSVRNATLEDIVYPTDIVGKRIRYTTDGKKLTKVFLNPKDRNVTEYKLETFSGVYQQLTGEKIVFEYPIVPTSRNA